MKKHALMVDSHCLARATDCNVSQRLKVMKVFLRSHRSRPFPGLQSTGKRHVGVARSAKAAWLGQAMIKG